MKEITQIVNIWPQPALPATPKGRSSAPGGAGRCSAGPLDQSSAHRMVRRRLRQAGIRSLAGNHSFRATGIINDLRNGGKLELAQQMAAHASPRTTSLI